MTDEVARIFEMLIKKAEVYVIQPGDTFDKIIHKHPTALQDRLMVHELADANQGINPAKLQIGQGIIIPTGEILAEIRRKREAPRATDELPLKQQIDVAFTSAAHANGVSEEILRGMAMVESSGNICATSGAGAQGLMQLMPQIQRLYGVSDPKDPISSIWGAAAHLSAMMQAARNLLKYMPNQDVEKVALTMYNLGETAYREIVRSGGRLPRESAEYADKVRAAAGARLNYTCNGNRI
jgi:soluble lytic murein transglycosylase-like protein